ncbi:MAG: hypothetical protein HN348_06560 [Proteobacteria bacterium]|jgi:predicted deacylase|nr:hypothetical protein [Pseudomonadota bacterium]
MNDPKTTALGAIRRAPERQPEPRVRVTAPVDGVVGTELFEAIGRSGPREGPRVAIIGLMHGDEPVGAQTLDRFAKLAPTFLMAGSVLTVRANLAAVELNTRHTPDGVDLNRQWSARRLEKLQRLPEDEHCYETRRVGELAPLLMDCRITLDLHSTSRPSPPSLIYRDDQRHAAIARKLGVKHLVTGLHESAILSGGMCSNAGLHPGEYSERLGYTFEAGQHLDPKNLERAWEVVVRLLAELGMWGVEISPSDTESHTYEVLERFRQAPEGAMPYRFVGYVGGEPGGGRHGTPRKLASFETIEADEVLLRRGRTTVVRAQAPFTMLMPCPTAAPGTDLYYVTQRRDGGLTDGRPRTDDEALTESSAIERMLDLLADDDFARGNTWVSFDSRRVLDLCADMTGRAIRMRRNDPDRRITVLGRGDWGGEEAERRSGQRYRQAMRVALVDGVPLERIQLLRGAALGWLEALTSASMMRLVVKRADMRHRPVHLLLSTKQPSTVSVLVVGNLERALRTGEVRHVRVVLVIEEAMVEPDGGGVRVNILRAGVLSNRQEFLEAVQSLIGALRDEHSHLVNGPLFSNDEAIKRVLTSEGMIEARPDRVLLGELRRSLHRLQLRLWCDALRHEVPGRLHLRNELHLGRFLAGLVSATGILDVDALKALLIRRHGNRWVVDPELLERVKEDPDTFVFQAEPSRQSMPMQPILSCDVHSDNLERWIGWKRFLKGVEVIPGLRGKDLDLTFTEEGIQRRVARWFRWTRRLAQKSPGKVMIVLAGDGMSPVRERSGVAWDALVAHRAVVADANIRYLRIQHSRGTHLAWLKDFFDTLQERPAGQPVAVQWEEQHGASVNVVLICLADEDAGPVRRPWSLDGWSIHGCAILVSDLKRSGGGYQVALFTEPVRGDPKVLNQELLHFGREHCEGLLRQAGHRVQSKLGVPERVELDAAVVDQIAGWIERVRRWKEHPVVHPPAGGAERADWIAHRLGLADESLARALALEMETKSTALAAARNLWQGIQAWPGPLWGQLRDREGLRR